MQQAERDELVIDDAFLPLDSSEQNFGDEISGQVDDFQPELRFSEADSALTPTDRTAMDHSPFEDFGDARPISVLKNREDGSRGEPKLLSGDNMDGAGRGPGKLDDSFPVELHEPTSENVLRTNLRRRQEPTMVSRDDEMQLDLSLVDELQDENKNPLEKSCEYFRETLLNQPINEIALDMSPPANTDLFGDNEFRVWRDASGQRLTEGRISDIRQGYVVIDTGNGQVRLPYARLSDADWAAISEYWGLPTECGLGYSEFQGRFWASQTATWHASALCHKPLYFENRQLERYGHSHGPILQPIMSTGHFFTRLVFWPYNWGVNPPNQCQYALGFYRPGNCAPWLSDPVPISLRGAVTAGLFYTAVGTLTQ